jgi:hypothetical protein
VNPTAEDFAQYCGLTCLGGSEQKKCPCLGPHECEMKGQPGFQAASDEARRRMIRHLMRGIEEDERARLQNLSVSHTPIPLEEGEATPRSEERVSTTD